MRRNNVMSIIFPNTHEESIPELTAKRTMGSLPFGAEYRLIDFPLSNMVNAGIRKIGVVTKQNYQSLMDHLGSGKAWGLSRKRDGLFILPPFGNSHMEFNSRIETLTAISGFLTSSKEDYILLTDCDVVCNIDYNKLIDSHIQKGADMTIVYKQGEFPQNFGEALIIEMNTRKKVTSVVVDPNASCVCNFGLNMIFMKRELLLQLLLECRNKNQTDFKRHLIQNNFNKYKVFGYEFTGPICVITSREKYFEANMKLTDPEFCKHFFNVKYPIYTKVRDDMPTKYGPSSSVSNSIIAEGCQIEGCIENSVLFRGVKIGENSHISNCIIMQDTIIEKNCELNYTICDKDVIIHAENKMTGCRTYPIYIRKSSVI